MITELARPLETGWLPDTPIGDSLLRRFVANQAGVAEDQPSPCCQRLIALLIEDPPLPPEAAAAVSALIIKHMH